jgi:hypothetical protein
MAAGNNALAIDSCSPEEDLALAGEMLAGGTGTVIVDALLALRVMDSYVQCDVIDPAPSAHRCEHEYEVLMENAQRMLEASRFRRWLPALPCRWRIVAVNGDAIEEVWRVV